MQESTPITNTPAPTPMPASPEPSKAKSSNSILFLIIALVLLGCGFSALLIYLNKSNRTVLPTDADEITNVTTDEDSILPSIRKQIKSDSILVTFNDKSFAANESFADNIKNASKVYTLFEHTNGKYKKISDISSYLEQPITINNSEDYITASVLTKVNSHTISAVTIFGEKHIYSNATYKYKDLGSFVSVNYVPEGTFYIDDKQFQFDVTKKDDVKQAFGNVSEGTISKSLNVKYKGYTVSFDINSYGEKALTGVMIMKNN